MIAIKLLRRIIHFTLENVMRAERQLTIPARIFELFYGMRIERGSNEPMAEILKVRHMNE